MENMLHSFGYNVTTCQRAEEALSLLCKDGRRYDILISEVHLPEMDGFNLLEITKDVKFMFKHVIRKKREIELKEIEPLKIMEQVNIVSNNTTANEGDGKILKRAIRNHEVEGELLHDLTTKEKKPRFVWTTEVHGIFLKAVAEVMAESDRPVPKKIQEKMQNMGVNVTRENVASHLQKFRLNRNKKTNLIQSTPELIKPYPVEGECKHVNALPSDPSHHNLITTLGVDSPTLLGNLVSNVVNINETFHEGHVEANNESPNLSDPPFEARIQMIDDTTMNQPFDSMLSPPVSYEIQVQALEDNVAVITSMEPNDYPTIEYLLPGQDCAIEGNGTAPMEIDDPISLFNTNNIYVNNFSIEYTGLNVGYENPAEKNAHVLRQ
ncbi:Two-component response regulator [Parasponia andersonii]|uniref:Two-component response regulator n=1 Tax=Parasponia andersonii TaxID=3476 RepID=A0A2P5AVJ6_PARAD|nr:Two-component response regulator [Parasponia andersonii]